MTNVKAYVCGWIIILKNLLLHIEDETHLLHLFIEQNYSALTVKNQSSMRKINKYQIIQKFRVSFLVIVSTSMAILIFMYLRVSQKSVSSGKWFVALATFIWSKTCMTTQMNIQMGNNETEDLNAGNTGYGFDHRLYYVKLMNRTIRYEICWFSIYRLTGEIS